MWRFRAPLSLKVADILDAILNVRLKQMVLNLSHRGIRPGGGLPYETDGDARRKF